MLASGRTVLQNKFQINSKKINVSTADPELDYLNGCGIIRYSLRVKVYIYITMHVM